MATHNLSVNQTTYVSEYENVTCCDICDRFHFLALGLSTGNVIIYHLSLESITNKPPQLHNNDSPNDNNNKQEQPLANGGGGGDGNQGEKKLHFRLELLVIFSAHQYNLIPQTFALDDVREVSWSDSGTSLAISWKKGVVVYSVRGIVVFSTLHHQIKHNDDMNDDESMEYINTKNKNQKDDPITTYYPSCLVWSQKDSGFIMVTHKNEVNNDDFNHYLRQYHLEKKLKQKRLHVNNKMSNIDESKEDDDDDNDNNNNNNIDTAYQCKDDAFLMQIKCLKHTLGNLSQCDVSKLALLGSNYISIWRPVHIIDDPESTDYWSRIEIDSHYLSRNWPIRELAVNLRSDCFAIAGSTGFAMYFRKTARWRIVRSLDGENILFTCVMTWLTNDLIFIATFDPTFKFSSSCNNGTNKQSKWNLLCFDRWEIDRYFSNNNSSGIPISNEFIPMMEYPLTNHPIGMEAVDNDKLLIYFVDGVIHIYDINIDNGKDKKSNKNVEVIVDDDHHSLKTYPIISLKNYCVLAPFTTLSPHPVSLRIWNYGHYNDKNPHYKDCAENIIAMNANKDDAGFCIISLDAARCLYKINPVNNEKELITENVHDFYLMRETRDKNDKCYLWTYGLNCVKRWDIIYDKQNGNKLTLKSLFVSPVQAHMTCIGICNTLNVLVYGRRIIRKQEPLYTPRFAIHIDIRSYLHITIKHKLNTIGLEPTFDFVLKAIAGGAWRCLNALETILRTSLQKRHKLLKRKKNNKNNNNNTTIITTSSDDATLNETNADGATLPFEQDALLVHQSLRSTYVFYPNDVERDFSRQNLNLQTQQQQKQHKQSNNNDMNKIKHIKSKTNDSPKNANDDGKNKGGGGDIMQFSQIEDGINELNQSGADSAINGDDNDNDDDDDGNSVNDTLMMMSTISYDENDNNNNENNLKPITICEENKNDELNPSSSSFDFGLKINKNLDEFKMISMYKKTEEEKEIDIVIKFLRKFPDYPGIVVNVARKTEPSQWNDLFKLCGSPIMLIEKSITRNQLATASKYLYVFEKIYIEYAIHFATLLIELAIESGSDNLVLSLLRFSHKLKLMIKESHENNIEIPQLNINID